MGCISLGLPSPGSGETYQVDTVGNGDVHRMHGEGDEVLCAEAAMAAVW